MDRLTMPVGIELFPKLRKENFYYVDKTALVADLLRGGSPVVLFTRPRRFGKTLALSMLRSFFEIGTDKSLFDGLAISKEKELCARNMGRYPVVCLTMKGVMGSTFDEAYQMLRSAIREECLRFQFLKDSGRLTAEDLLPFLRILHEKDNPTDIKSSLYVLTKLLCKHYGKEAVILIDEYDVPLNQAHNNGYFEKMAGLVRALFQAGLKTNSYLRLAALTGCLRISKESIFTGLNNIRVCSIMDPGGEERFGFSEGEVSELMEYYGLQSHIEEARQWYDGYDFGGKRIYCPWDVASYCSELARRPEAKPGSYWINSSGNDLVRKLIDLADTTTKREIERLIAGEALEKEIHMELTGQDIGKSIDNLWSVLLTTGYLTTAGTAPDGKFRLVIPNREVREVYHEWRNTPCFSYGDISHTLFSRMGHPLAFDSDKRYNICMKYKSNNNVVYSCKYHVVWCPKYRRKVLVDGIDARLEEIIEEICKELCVDVIEMEIMPDHVHLLMEVDPQFGIHRAVKQIKGRSSHVLRQEFNRLRSRLPSLWTNSYFVSTVGGAPLSAIKQYIENQKNV